MLFKAVHRCCCWLRRSSKIVIKPGGHVVSPKSLEILIKRQHFPTSVGLAIFRPPLSAVPQYTACPQLKIGIATIISGINSCNDLSTLLPSSGNLWNRAALLILEYFLGGLMEPIEVLKFSFHVLSATILALIRLLLLFSCEFLSHFDCIVPLLNVCVNDQAVSLKTIQDYASWQTTCYHCITTTTCMFLPGVPRRNNLFMS
jgi:hypothetical protein